ncbi:hypothetical protein ID144_25245 [Pseudomonas sp. JM0905a]|nr:hypothetical protein [Pseudomonas sp. JM0905a]MBD2840359.1 hypothetical protein [Pseudomonas sp. JM0905a]
MRDHLAYLLTPTLLGILLLISLLGEQPPARASYANGIPLVSLSQIFH